MKNLSVFLFGLLVLAGCASANVKEKDTAASKSAEPPKTEAAKPASADTLADTNTVLLKHSVYFAFDQSVITNADRAVLEDHAKYLSKHASTKIVLQGNTDERGSSEYNLALGNRRAEGAKKALAILGVKREKIEAVSFGKEKPTALCHEETCWAENRRADIVYNSVN